MLEQKLPGAETAGPSQPTILNLGCGRKHLVNAVNLDIVNDTHPDLVHDLNRRPWPFADGRFEQILAHDVIEHLDDPLAVFEEIHRISSHGAVVDITVPHFSCANAFADPTHRRFFSYFSMDYVTGESEFSFYTKFRFKCLSRQIVFHPTLLNKIVRRLANLYPHAYEQRWAWMFPAWFLSFRLEVLKSVDTHAVNSQTIV